MASQEPNKDDECIELKNIKYKTMLLSGTILQETKSSTDLSNLDKFLEENKSNKTNEPWSKLDKTMKTKNGDIIQIPSIEDRRGSLCFLENNLSVPFKIKRLYYIFDVPSGTNRGGHAHKKLQQIFFFQGRNDSFTSSLLPRHPSQHHFGMLLRIL
jgi:hypothetical protein